MKKTLFLSAILGAALCSSAFAAEKNFLNYAAGETVEVNVSDGHLKGSDGGQTYTTVANLNITSLVITDGYSRNNGITQKFTGTITGAGPITRTNGQTNQHWVFTGDMSQYTGTMTMNGATNSLTFGADNGDMTVGASAINMLNSATLKTRGNVTFSKANVSVEKLAIESGTLTIDSDASVNFTGIDGWTATETSLDSGNGFGTTTYSRDFGSTLVNRGTITLKGAATTMSGGVVSSSNTQTTYYINDGSQDISLGGATQLVVNNTEATIASGFTGLTSIALNGSATVLDLTGTAVETSNIKKLLTAVQGDGLLKMKTGNWHWASMDAASVLNANVDVTGNGLEIDSGSLRIAAGKTLNVNGKMQFENDGTLTVEGTLNSTHVGLGHGARGKGNLVVSGDGILKTGHFEKVKDHQSNTITLRDGGSLQITDSNFAALNTEQANAKKSLYDDDFVVTITNGKLIADGNDWTLNHAATIGAAQVLGANTVTMNDTVTFTEGATVTVGSADKAGKLTISGSFSGEDAAFVVKAGSTLTLNSDVAINGLTIGTGASVVANGALTLSGAASYTGSTSTRDVTSATLNGFETTETYATAISGTGSVTGDATWTLNGQAATFSNGVVSYTTQGTTYNIKESDSRNINEDTAILNLHNTATITDSTFTVTDYMDVKDNTVLTFSGTTVDANRIWLHNGSVVNLDENSTVSVDNLTIAGGTISASAVAEMGTYGNDDFNAAAVLTGSDITANGTLVRGYTMNGGKLTITKANTTVNAHLSSAMNLVIEEDASAQFSATSLTIGALTLGADASITVNDHNGTLNITGLTVTGDNAAINADLVMNSGTLFIDNTTLTMGCDVTIGSEVTVVLTDTMIDAVNTMGSYDLIDSVGTATLGNVTFVDTHGATLGGLSLTQVGDKIVVAPEPATATLSLLALAALCARRKRH